MVLWIPALQSTNILLSLFPLDEVTPGQLTLMSDVIGSMMYMEREIYIVYRRTSHSPNTKPYKSLQHGG